MTAQELLDAIDKRFRLKVALEGAVAEVHFERKLKVATREGWLNDYEAHDVDGMHDFTVVTRSGTPIRVEVKTVRNSAKPKVELQKTRTSKSDTSRRYYDFDRFDVVAVCVGRRTGDWSQFRYSFASGLQRHKEYPGKLEVFHYIPDDETSIPRWFSRLQDVIDAYEP